MDFLTNPTEFIMPHEQRIPCQITKSAVIDLPTHSMGHLKLETICALKTNVFFDDFDEIGRAATAVNNRMFQ